MIMKKWKKYATAALAAMVCASVLAGCGGGKKEEAKANEIKIGASFELTGNVANYGKAILSGAKMAFDEANAKGGVLGKKIVVIESDNKSEPSESGNSITKLVTQDKVVAIVGPATSGCVAAGAPITEANKVPQIAPSGTAPGLTVDNNGKVRPFMFRACFIDPFQGQVMAHFASNSLKVKNVAILMDSSSDYSKGLAQVFQETLEKAGGKIVTKEAFLSKDLDFKASLTKIKATNPEAVYVPGYYEEVSKIIKQAREIGLDVPMLGCDGWESPKLAEIAGKDALTSCYYVSAFSAQDTDPSVQAFIKAYKEKYQKEPDIFAMQGYNAGLVVVDSIKRANSTDGTAIAKAMAETKDLPVASGKLTYDANHNPIISALIISLDGGVPSLKEKIAL